MESIKTRSIDRIARAWLRSNVRARIHRRVKRYLRRLIRPVVERAIGDASRPSGRSGAAGDPTSERQNCRCVRCESHRGARIPGLLSSRAGDPPPPASRSTDRGALAFASSGRVSSERKICPSSRSVSALGFGARRVYRINFRLVTVPRATGPRLAISPSRGSARASERENAFEGFSIWIAEPRTETRRTRAMEEKRRN